MRVIMVAGYAGSGKDESARFIQEHSTFQQRALAFPLKEVSKFLFGWNNQQTDGPMKEIIDPVWGFSPRKWLQWFGTDIMQFGMIRKFENFRLNAGRNFWGVWLITHNDNDSDIVISDVRFKHEVNFFKNTVDDVTVIRVKRGKRGFFKRLFSHQSEKEVDKITADYVIENNGTLEELYGRLEQIMKNLGVWQDGGKLE